MSNEVNLLIIGAVISIVSTMIGLFSQITMDSVLKNKGKVKIYTKKVYNKTNSKTWGFSGDHSDMTFMVPLWVEFHNTKEKIEIIRNLNLQLFVDKKRITNMVQVSHFGPVNKRESYANNGSYSFILEPTSINKYVLLFRVKKSEVEINFEEVKLSYYDSKDKYHEIPFLKIESPWCVDNQLIDKDWISLN